MFKLKECLPTEHQEQEVFMKWLKMKHPDVYDLTYHIPNGRLNAREGAKYKRLGAKSGVPDICVAFPVKPYHGLYIEFKRKDGGGGVSDNQKNWLSMLEAVGYCCAVANGFDDAVKILENYWK